MEKETLIRLFEDSKAPARCRGCSAPIEFYETLRQKRMPMNAGAVPRKSEIDMATNRVVAFFAASDSHFNSCPDAPSFSRKAASRP